MDGSKPSLEDWRAQARSVPRVSFADRQLTTREKAGALVEFGLADDPDEAVAMLVDMGEATEAQADAYRDSRMHDRSGDPDYSERDEDDF